jgi:hypothetical protein
MSTISTPEQRNTRPYPKRLNSRYEHRPPSCSQRRCTAPIDLRNSAPHHRWARKSEIEFSEVGNVSDEVKVRPRWTGPSPRPARLSRQLISPGGLLGTVNTTHPNLRNIHANIPALHSSSSQHPDPNDTPIDKHEKIHCNASDLYRRRDFATTSEFLLKQYTPKVQSSTQSTYFEQQS